MINLQQAGIPVANVVAFGLHRRFPFHLRNLLVIRTGDGFVTLARWFLDVLRRHGGDAGRYICSASARILPEVRRMHEAGICHGDLNPGNVLIDQSGERFLFIDFHRSRRLRPGQMERRAADISKLVLHIQAQCDLLHEFDVVSAYAEGDEYLLDSIRPMCDRVHQWLAQKWIDHVVNQCLDTRTHFRKLQADNATVYMDRRYPASALLEIAAGRATGDEWTHERLSGTRQQNRRYWREAVRKSILGETRRTPVALVCRPLREGGSLLIWDPDREPTYCLKRMFSLAPFDSSAGNDLFTNENRHTETHE